MKKAFYIYIVALLIMLGFQACENNSVEELTNNSLFQESQQDGYFYFQNGNLLSAKSPSPHGSFKLRFNTIAHNSLDSSGELPQGNTFPNGSMLVKEVYDGNKLSLIVLMKKDPSVNTANQNWVWAEFNVDGSEEYSPSKKGEACVSCHSGQLNRDLTRTFDLH